MIFFPELELSMPKWIDLTRTLSHGMAAFPGDDPPEFVQKTDVTKEGYTTFRVSIGVHVGTHLDAPWHMVEGGKCLSDLPVERFMGKGCLVDARGKSRITAEVLGGKDLEKTDIVFVYTGFEKHFNDPQRYFGTYPEMTEDFAMALVQAGTRILGMDTASPDRDAPFVVHKTLLAREILLIENLVNLESLVGAKQFEVIALPAKFKCEAGPVRVIARILKQ